MARLISHRFEAGQRWKNPGFTLYILAVNDDLPDDAGVLRPGKICVSEEAPFPGRKFTATDLAPSNMEEVVQKGGYELMPEGWMPEFERQAAAIRANAPPAPDPIKPPAVSGLGAMLMK